MESETVQGSAQESPDIRDVVFLDSDSGIGATRNAQGIPDGRDEKRIVTGIGAEHLDAIRGRRDGVDAGPCEIQGKPFGTCDHATMIG